MQGRLNSMVAMGPSRNAPPTAESDRRSLSKRISFGLARGTTRHVSVCGVGVNRPAAPTQPGDDFLTAGGPRGSAAAVPFGGRDHVQDLLPEGDEVNATRTDQGSRSAGLESPSRRSPLRCQP
jgi:hypothetical protein